MALNPYHPGEWQQSTTPGGPGAPTPAVVTWFKVYCGVLAVLYLLFAGMGVIYFVIPAEEMEMAEAEAKIVGSVFIGMGGLFFVAAILPFFLPRRPWVWVYDLVLIALGMTSACFIPACIPLLIFWLKPEAKQYFGKPG